MTRCKLQALKCKFNQAELEERLIEQLIVGTRLPELQKELLAKDENLTLEKALNIRRTNEASISHMIQFPGKVSNGGLPSHDSVANRSNTTLTAYNGSRIPQYGSSVEDGLIMKGERVVIPHSVQPEVLER